MFARTLRVGFENGLANFEVAEELASKAYGFILHYKTCLDIEFSDSIKLGTYYKDAEDDKQIEP